MKRKALVLVLAFLLSGCIQSKEHLVVEKDGSGTLEASMVIPTGTIQLLDTMMGGMMQAMAGTMGQEGQKQMAPESVADQMFGNKEQMLKKAEEAGVAIEILSFDKEKKDDGIHVDYKIKYDDVQKLLASELVSTSLALKKDADGNWYCEIKSDPQKAQQSKVQLAQLQSFKESEEFNQMDALVQNMVTGAMGEMKIDFLMTLPYKIKECSGMFEKLDDQTVRLEFSGNFMEDPTIIEKLYGMSDQDSKVVWASGTDAVPEEKVSQEVKKVSDKKEVPKKKSDADTKVYLNNGTTVEGKMLEKTKDSVKISVSDVAVTFYNDEIKNIESLK